MMQCQLNSGDSEQCGDIPHFLIETLTQYLSLSNSILVTKTI